MASSVASLVIRRAVCRSFPSLTPIRRPRCFSTRISSSVALRVLTSRTLVCPCPAISVRHASSSTSKAISPDDLTKRADKNLLRVLETEIECAEDSDDGPPQQKVAVPEDCPFEIVDSPGDQSILLKRQFQGENIEVCVLIEGEEEEEEAGDEDDEDEGKGVKGVKGVAQPSISLAVTINKGDGPSLEFCCNLDSEGLEVESLTLKRPGEVDNEEEAYGGPAFSDLDESLSKALRKYLVVRGIKPSLYNFLSDYMMSKEDKEYVNWLKNIKEFIAK